MAQNTATTSTKKPNTYLTGEKRWNTIYPAYINSKKTIAEGRRIPKGDCVEDPNIVQLFEAVRSLGLPCKPEPEKAYPRDFTQRGRVKVCIFKEDGSLTNPSVTSKHDLLVKISKAIPTLPQHGAAGGAGQDKKGGKKGKNK